MAYPNRRRRSHRPSPKPEFFIEPKRGATYSGEGVAVYSYDEYPESSVLAGQQRRCYVEGFDTVEDAKREYPHATVSESSLYQPVSLDHLPDDGDSGVL